MSQKNKLWKHNSLVFRFGNVKEGRIDEIDYWDKDIKIRASSTKSGWLVFTPDEGVSEPKE